MRLALDPVVSACLLLAGYGVTLWYTHGEYAPLAIVGTFALFLLQCTLFLGEARVVTSERTAERILSAVFVLFFGLVLFNPMLRAFTNTLPALAMRGFLILSLVGFALFQAKRTRTVGFWLALVALAEAHLMVILVDPAPAIDIWLFYQKASGHFWAGQNPYLQTDYPEIYGGRYGYPPGLHYLPASLYFLAPFQRLFGDVRVGLWAAQVGSALLLGTLARRVGLSERLQGLAVLVWLIFPATLPVLENCWIDTLLGFWTLATLVAWLRGSWGVATVCLAIALATKQTMLIMGFVTLAFFLAHPGLRRRGLPCLGLACLGAVALMLPYALWHWESYWRSVTQVFRNQIRLDSFNLVALAINGYGLKVEFWQTLLIYLALIPIVVWRLARRRLWRDWLGGVIMLVGLTFYFGKQAFLNYYEMLSLFVLAYLILAMGKEPEA